MASTLLFPEKDRAFREDIRLLGRMLGDILKEQGPPGLYERVESVRRLARRRRDGEEGAELELVELLRDLDPELTDELVRAFSSFFFLVNMAERIHRIRRSIDYMRASLPQPGSWEAVIASLGEGGLSLSDMRPHIENIRLEPVFTAHPTEAVRRTLLVKEQRIARALIDRLDFERLLESERSAALERIRAEVTTAWQTEEHLSVRPSVADEVEHVLFYVSEVIYRVVPRFYENLEEALIEAFGEQGRSVDATKMLRFVSWVGGDMDGNPNVGPETIKATLERHLALCLDRYAAELRDLAQYLSQSITRVGVDPAVLERAREYADLMPEVDAAIPERYRGMPYRVLLMLISGRLAATRSSGPAAYMGPDRLIEDLELIDASLREHGGAKAGAHLVRRLLRRVKTFGFHLACLDTRQDALVHREAIADILDDPSFLAASIDERCAALQSLVRDASPPREGLSEETEKCIAVMRVLKEARQRYGPRAIGISIISMAQGPDDALAVLALARQGGFFEDSGEVPLDIAPLFETVPDLQGARASLESLWADPGYRAHLKSRGDRQYVMLGYSDSNKESGLGAARWALYKAQRAIVAAARGAGLEVTLFHGRGGTISRGGGKTRGAILGEPPGAVAGRVRVTEQGEIIHAKYGLRGLAIRTLEQMGGAALERAPDEDRAELIGDEDRALMDTLAQTSRAAFRGLIYEDPDFYQYFREATPVDVIERLRIGSRPIARRQQKGIQDLRAIPWVFAWTQSRHILPGWYGLGVGLEAAADKHGLDALKGLARRWRFFANLLSDAEMVLAKADLAIAARYAELCESAGERIFGLIKDEHDRTRRMICEIKGIDELLQREPVLRRALLLRNPYVDPMSLMQVDLLKRWRASGRQDDFLEKVLITTVHGIARGMQNTG